MNELTHDWTARHRRGHFRVGGDQILENRGERLAVVVTHFHASSPGSSRAR